MSMAGLSWNQGLWIAEGTTMAVFEVRPGLFTLLQALEPAAA
jgi:hypothetical protein